MHNKSREWNVMYDCVVVCFVSEQARVVLVNVNDTDCNLLDDFVCLIHWNNITWAHDEPLVDPKENKLENKMIFISWQRTVDEFESAGN